MKIYLHIFKQLLQHKCLSVSFVFVKFDPKYLKIIFLKQPESSRQNMRISSVICIPSLFDAISWPGRLYISALAVIVQRSAYSFAISASPANLLVVRLQCTRGTNVYDLPNIWNVYPQAYCHCCKNTLIFSRWGERLMVSALCDLGFSSTTRSKHWV